MCKTALTCTNENDTIRKQYINISERQFAFCLAGQLYEQAPNRYPRNVEIIMKKAIEAFRNHENCTVIFGDSYNVSIPSKDTYEFCDKLLRGIPEFIDLNLTYNEFISNIKIDDPNRPKFSVTTAFDIRNEDSWKEDFIDIDAFIGNFHRKLFNYKEIDEDCFLCKYQSKDNKSTLAPGNSDKCKTCKINPTFKSNYECNREIKGKYTISCNYDCVKLRYICCSECDDKETCKFVCKGTPDTCNNHE